MVSSNEVLNAVKVLVDGGDVARGFCCNSFKKVWICNVCTAVRALSNPMATDEEIKATMLDMSRSGKLEMSRCDLVQTVNNKLYISDSAIYPLGSDNHLCSFHFVTVRV